MPDPITPPSSATPQPSTPPARPAGPPPNLPTQSSSPSPSLPQPPSFSSSIRTMGSDQASVKGGQAPAGIKLDKKPESSSARPEPAASTPVSPVTPAKPTITPPPAPRPAAAAPAPSVAPSLPPKPATPPTPPAPQPAKPIVVPPATPVPAKIVVPSIGAPSPVQPPTTPSTLNIPSATTSSSSPIKPLYLIIGAIVLVMGGAAVWLFLQSREEVAVSPTPTAFVSQTPEPPSLKRAFGSSSSLVLRSTDTPSAVISDHIRNESIGSSSIRTYSVRDDANSIYTFKAFLERFGITPPAATALVFDTSSWVFGLYGHADSQATADDLDAIVDTFEDPGLATATPTSFASIKKPFIALEVSDPITAEEGLTAWETTIIKDFSPIMGYTVKKQAALGQDFYNGIRFKYIQLPDKNSGLAYAIVDRFIVFASSRDSFRAAVDALQK